MANYVLDTVWRVATEPEVVWPVLITVGEWPAWWRGVQAVECLKAGDPGGQGRCYRTTWRGRLPYTLTFETETLHIERPVLIESQAHGQLQGAGTWRLLPDGDATHIHYRWAVATTRPWMNALAPLARPVFRWNHDTIMRWEGTFLGRLCHGRRCRRHCPPGGGAGRETPPSTDRHPERRPLLRPARPTGSHAECHDLSDALTPRTRLHPPGAKVRRLIAATLSGAR